MKIFCWILSVSHYALTLSSESLPLDFTYNTTFRPSFDDVLKNWGHPKEWPLEIHAVQYPPVLISRYDDEAVHESSVTSKSASEASDCYPYIKLEGCSIDAKRPTQYLPHEFVKIRVVPLKRSAACKNLVARLNKPVEFIEEDSPGPRRRQMSEWQNNKDLTFEQKEPFFQYGASYTAVLGIEVLGSYMSVIGEDLVMDFNVTCFFKIDPPQSIVSVEGGSGTYDCSKPVEFRPVQTEPAFDKDLFTLRWSCTSQGASDLEQCEPEDTKWGSKRYKLGCNRVYLFKLEPFHPFFELTSSIKSNAGNPFEWTVETSWGASHIWIRCLNSCFMVNPQSEVYLEAIESPRADTDLVWRLFEGNQTTPVPLSEFSNKLINKRALSIKSGSLKPSTSYRILAESSRGKGEIIFDTSSPPRGGTCSIVPTVGIKGKTEFTVSCSNWTVNHNPILYSVGVVVDGLYVALVDSIYPDKIPLFVLYFDKVRLTIQDGVGMAASVDLKVVLLHLSNDNAVVIHSKGDFRSQKNEALINSMIAFTDNTVNAELKTAILRSLIELLPRSRTVYDLEGLIGCVLLVLNHHSDGYMEDGVQELIKLSGEILLVASNMLRTISSTAGRSVLIDAQIKNCTIAMMNVADVLFQTRDPFLLESSTASLDVQEVHRYKVKLGAKAALEALRIVLAVARASLIPDFGSLRYDVGTTVIFTSVGHAKTLQTQLDELGQTVATVRLSERIASIMGGDIYAVEVIVTDKEAYWWKPVSGQVLHAQFFKRNPDTKKFSQIEMFSGPFDIPVKIDPDLNNAVVLGVASRAAEPCANETKCQRLVTIHRIHLPPGQGAISIELDPVHFGKIKMIAIQDSVPTYSEIDSVNPVNRAKVDVKYNNQGIRLISNFYIAVISAKYDMYQYDFYVQLGRCAYYVSEEWQSQGCQFKGIIKAKDGSYSAVCRCSHLSTVGYGSIFPVPDLPNFGDLSLLFSLHDNWMVVAVIGLIVVMYFLLLIYGAVKDKKDHQKEALTELPDNYPGDTYPYIIIIVTGMRCGAGTSSKVAFQLFGSRSRSRPHLFKGGKLKDTLNRGCDDWLLLFTRRELGDIEGIYVWHSNTGCSPDWYCSQITVYDVKNDKPYAFKVRRWFKIDPQNLDESKLWRGIVNRVDWEVRETKPMRICGDRFILSLKDEHNWANIFLRHPRSVFTRCERIAALGSMIFTSMFFSILYFGSGDFSASDVPGFTIELSDLPKIIISFSIGWIIGKILSILTLSLFSLSKEKLRKPMFGPPVVKKRCCGLIKTKQKPELFDLVPITTKEGLKYRDAAKPSRLKCLRCLAWVVIIISIFLFTFFIVLYGLRFGLKRSLLWIQSVIFSLMVDAIIWGPGKMALKAYMSSRRKGALTHDYFMEIDPDTLWPASMNYLQRMERTWYRIRKEYKPFSYRRLLRMSKVRAFSDFFNQYIIYFIFLATMFTFTIFFIENFNTKVRYLANTALHHQLTEPKAPGVNFPKQIVTAEEFVEYVNRTLLVSLHRHKWYNGQLLPFEPSEERVTVNKSDLDAGYKGWSVGLLNKLHGVPRLRQQRVTTKPWKIIEFNTTWWKWEWEVDVAETVSPYFAKYFNVSLNALSEFNEEKDTYKAGWEGYNPATDANLTNLWTYSTTAETLTGVYFGKLLEFHGMKYVHYHGKGYVHLLYWSRAVSAQKLFQIINQGWIDNRTRVIFVEVNLYNVHLNLFSQSVVTAERAASGVFKVHVKTESATLTNVDPFRNTWMYMTYTLIPLLILFVIYYFQESSAYGVSTIVSWQGLSNLAIIMVAFYVVKLNFDKATRFNVFSDTLDTSVRDQFDPLYVPFHLDQITEVFCASFGLVVVAALVTVVYRLLGYMNFKKMFVPVQALMAAAIVVNFFVNIRSAAAFRTLGIINLEIGAVDTFFKALPYSELQRLSHKEQSFVIFFMPFCFFFLKSLMGAIIFYYDHGTDEDSRKIGISAMFVRRPTDPELHKRLDQQDKVLEKKMGLVTKKLMQVSKKYIKKTDDQKLYHAQRRDHAKDDEPVPKGWLEAVWGGQAGHNLEDLEAEGYKEVELPANFKKGIRMQEFEDDKPKTDVPLLDPNTSMVLKPTSADALKKLEEEKKLADEKKKLEDKKKSVATKPDKEKKSEDKKKSVAMKPDEEKRKSEATFIGGKKSLVIKPADEEKKSEVPTSAETKKSLPESADDKKKSMYKDADDIKKSLVPKPEEEGKKSEVPKSDDKKSLVPKPADDRKSIYKDAEDRKKSEVPKPTEDKKKSLYKDADDKRKSEVPKVEGKKEPATPETPIESKKSKLSNILKKMSNARKSKVSDARKPITPQQEKASQPGITSKDPELTKGGEKAVAPPEAKGGLNVSGAALIGIKSRVGESSGKPGTGGPSMKPGAADVGKPGAGTGGPSMKPGAADVAKPGVGTGGPSMKPGAGIGGPSMKPGAGIGGPNMKPEAGIGGPSMKPGAGIGGPSMKPGAGIGGPNMKPRAGIGGPSMKPGAGIGGPSMKPGAADVGKPGAGTEGPGMKPGAGNEGPGMKSGAGIGGPSMKPGAGIGGPSMKPGAGIGGPSMKPGAGIGGPSMKPGAGIGGPSMKPGAADVGKPGAGSEGGLGEQPGTGVAQGPSGRPGAGVTGGPGGKPTPSKPGMPGDGKPNAIITWKDPDPGADTPKTLTKPEAPPPRKPVYMGPGIQRPGMSGTSPPERRLPGAGKPAPSPQESSLGSPRKGPPPGSLTSEGSSAEYQPRRPLDWVFNRAKRHAPSQPQPPPTTAEPPLQSPKQQPQKDDRSPKRPRRDDAGPTKDSPSTPGKPPPRKPVYMGPGIQRPGISGTSPPERLGTDPPGAQQPQRPPAPPNRPEDPQEPRVPPRPPLQWMFPRRRQ